MRTSALEQIDRRLWGVSSESWMSAPGQLRSFAVTFRFNGWSTPPHLSTAWNSPVCCLSKMRAYWTP